ncbi:MAG: TRAP transporter large permease [Caulobacterales bacterium]|jgi:tripartite ATP-independent transporter DctM subunit
MIEMREILDVLMFATLAVALMSGAPVAFTLAGVALLFALLGLSFGVFDAGFLTAIPNRLFATMTNATLVAVPLFILMGAILERSKLAEQLLSTMSDLFGKMRGGVLISTTLVGALLAASTGVVGATVTAMGLLALPLMLKRGYDKGLASGSIAAAGTLGQIIPPSIVLILLGDVIGAAHQRAQLAQGTASPTAVSVGDLFAGAIVPGLLLVALYLIYQVTRAWLDPKAAPAAEDVVAPTFAKIISALAAPLALVLAVLGSILAGVATPTEGAAVGALGALMLAALKSSGAAAQTFSQRLVQIGLAGALILIALRALFDLRIGRAETALPDQIAIAAAAISAGLFGIGIIAAGWRLWARTQLQPALRSTAEVTTMVFTILIGAALFALVFRGLGGDEWIEHMLQSIPGGLIGALIAVNLLIFVLGFFLDFIEICYIVIPLVAAPLLMMGADPVWLGVMFAMNLQTSFLTPPFGFALFYLRGVAPASVTTLDIYRGVIPFIILQIIALLAVCFVPQLATWLPGVLYR